MNEDITEEKYYQLQDSYFDLMYAYTKLITYLQANKSETYQAYLDQEEE